MTAHSARVLTAAAGRIGILAAASLLLGCEGAPDREADRAGAGPTPIVRDSAGVRIVENASPRWGEDAEWRIDREPLLLIGVAQGDPAYELVSVGRGTRLEDGRIVLADGPRVRFYDASGRHLRSVGGRGGGPGEFYREPGAICVLPGGSLAVADTYHRRAHLFTQGGVPEGTTPISEEFTFHPVGCFGDGAWLALLREPASTRAAADGFIRVSSHGYYRVGGSAEPAGSGASGGSGDVRGPLVRKESEMSWTDGRPVGTSFGLPFTGTAHAVAGDRFVIYDRAERRLEIRRPDGALELVVLDVTPPRRTREVYDAFLDHVDALFPASELTRELSRVMRLDLPVPQHLPAYQSLSVDALGYIWAERFHRERTYSYSPPGAVEGRYDIFEPDGTWLGVLELPVGLRILEIGRDYILAVETNDLGVQRVVLHRVRSRDGQP